MFHRLVPLRKRRGDIGLLVADLLPRLATDRAATIRLASDLATAIVGHGYPLNVRELEHLLSIAPGDLVRGPAPPARRRTFELPASEPPPAARRSEHPAPRLLSPEDERLRDELTTALQQSRGNVSEIARIMGTTRMQIHRWMRRFGLDPETFRPG